MVGCIVDKLAFQAIFCKCQMKDGSMEYLFLKNPANQSRWSILNTRYFGDFYFRTFERSEFNSDFNQTSLNIFIFSTKFYSAGWSNKVSTFTIREAIPTHKMPFLKGTILTSYVSFDTSYIGF